jgi:pimeloyl-ACP methyl ester carboxylesterase
MLRAWNTPSNSEFKINPQGDPMDHKFERTEEEFISSGTSCAAWLYRPLDVEKPPVIIMAHGFAAERSFGLPDFAERFAVQGWAVFVFDYRTFGDSDGTPRNDVNPFKHSDDWDAAIASVRNKQSVDATKIVLWGTSFSGGHVTCAASRHNDISAIIAQVPFTGMPADTARPPLLSMLRILLHILLDRVKTAITGRPHYIPAIARPGSFAAMNTEESFDGYMALVPAEKSFANQVPAKIFGMMANYDPTAVADQVKCPALVIAGVDDSLIAVEQVAAMADRMPLGIFKTLDCNHFAPYKGEMFETNITLQIEFLNGVLGKA